MKDKDSRTSIMTHFFYRNNNRNQWELLRIKH